MVARQRWAELPKVIKPAMLLILAATAITAACKELRAYSRAAPEVAEAQDGANPLPPDTKQV